MTAVVSNTTAGPGFWATIGGGIKTGALWAGRTIKVGFTDYLVPAIKKIWPAVQKLFQKAWAFIKTAPGLGTLGCIIGVAAGVSLLAIAHRDGQGKGKRILLHILAVAAFIFGVGALAAGITFGIR